MAMNTKVFLLAIAVVAAVATFAIAAIASSDMLSGLGPTEVFAQKYDEYDSWQYDQHDGLTAIPYFLFYVGF
jgi:hypothetical protein